MNEIFIIIKEPNTGLDYTKHYCHVSKTQEFKPYYAVAKKIITIPS